MSGKRHSDLQCSVKEGTGKTSSLPADRIALSLRKWIPEFILVIYLQIRVLFIWVHSIPCQLTGTEGFMAPNDLESGYGSCQRWASS